jgi:hypothetical protein
MDPKSYLLSLNLIKKIQQLLFLNSVIVLKYTISFNYNKLSLKLNLYFKVNKLIAFRKKKDINLKEKQKALQIVSGSCLLAVLKKTAYLLKLNENVHMDLCIQNKKINKNITTFLYRKLKKDKSNLFNRQTNIYIDLLNLSYFYCFLNNDFKALGSIIVKIFTFTQKRNHSKFFRFIKKLFSILITRIIKKNNKVIGIKIQIKGRLKGKTRAQKLLMRIKSVPVQRLDLDIEYYEEKALTKKQGAFGFKFWILKKKEKTVYELRSS